MRLVRTYYNDANEIIREDAIDMIRRKSLLMDGPNAPTFYRSVRTTRVHVAGNRVVALIQIAGDYDDIDIVSGNYLFANWNFGPNANIVRCNMSDLALVGDTV